MKKVLFSYLLALLLIVVANSGANAAISSSPAIGSWSSTTSYVSGCSSSPNIIKASVSAISTNTVTVQIKRIDNGYFQSTGYAYVRLSTPCGNYYNYAAYNTGMTTVTVSFSVSISTGSSITIYGNTVSSTGAACHSGVIILTNSSAPSIVVNPTSLSFGSGATSYQIAVTTTNTTASISSSNSAFTLSTTGIANNICSYVTVYVSANYSAQRTGTITIYGSGVYAYVNITQAAGSCPSLLQWYSQVDNSWGANQLGTCVGKTISSHGCFMTCGAMLLTSEVSNTSNFTPATFNTYCTNNSGYSGGCDLVWAAPGNADGPGGLQYYASAGQNSYSWIDQQLDACRKVIVQVTKSDGKTHYVLVKQRSGTSGLPSSYKVLDPGLSPSNFAIKSLADFAIPCVAAHAYSGSWGTNFSYKEDEDLPLYVPIEQNEVVLYPNPNITGGNIQLRITSKDLQMSYISIYTMEGRMLSNTSEMLGEGVNEISLASEIPTGLYIVRVAFEDNTAISKRLIITN